MITRFFERDQPVLWFLWPIIVAILWIPSFIIENNIFIEDVNIGLLSKPILFLSQYKWLAVLITLLLVIIQGFMLKYISSKHELIKTNTFYIPFIYCLILSILQFDIILNPYLITSTLLFFAINKLLELGKEEKTKFIAFNSSIIIGIATILYYPFIYFLFIIWIALFLFKSFNPREWIQPLIGVFVPVLYLSVYWIWNNEFLDALSIFKDQLFRFSFFKNEHTTPTLNTYLFWGVTLIIISIATYLSLLNSSVIRKRYSHLFFIWILIISLLSTLFTSSSLTSFIVSSALLTSLIYAVMIINIRKKLIPELITWIGVVAIFINALIKSNYL